MASWRTLFTELKVGDKVMCIDNPNSKHGDIWDNEGRGAGWELLKVFIIGEIHSNIVWPENGDCGVFKDCVELV